MHREAIHRRRVRQIVQPLGRWLPRDVTLLDVGSGDARVAAELRRFRPDLQITCIDPLLRADAVLPVQAFDGERIPYEDASFDFAMLIDVIHHLPDPERMFAEIRRIARRGMVVKDHRAESSWDHALLSAMDWVGNVSHGVARVYRYWNLAEWQAAGDRLGGTWLHWEGALGLYPAPLGWLCDRHLQFSGLLAWEDAVPRP